MRQRFEQICIHLCFLLGTILLFQLGIQTAGAIIRFGEARKVQIINHVVEQLSVGVDKEKIQQTRDISIQYAGAYLRAIASFQFVPRNDMDTLTTVIGATPRQTTIKRFEYEGRDLLIYTDQPQEEQVEEMVAGLEESELFVNIVYELSKSEEGRIEGEIRCIAHQYEPITLWEGLKEFLQTIRTLGGKKDYGVT